MSHSAQNVKSIDDVTFRTPNAPKSQKFNRSENSINIPIEIQIAIAPPCFSPNFPN